MRDPGDNPVNSSAQHYSHLSTVSFGAQRTFTLGNVGEYLAHRHTDGPGEWDDGAKRLAEHDMEAPVACSADVVDVSGVLQAAGPSRLC